MHPLDLMITLAGGLAFAVVLGGLTQRLGLSTLVGYVIAGILVGPHTPGFNADPALAAQMAEIGVVLLMFGVGLHFDPRELLRVWKTALPGAVVQSALAAAAGWALARAFGWSHIAGAIFGFALAVASTVVLMRMLVERGRLNSADGHVAVGWLIVEDLFTVAALVVLPALARPGADGVGIALSAGFALLKVALFGVIVAVAGWPVTSRLLERVASTRSTELFTLTVFVIALGVAVIAAGVFDVSVALGAFFAGIVVGQSRFGPQAAAEMAPFRDVFSALFFVSVGMLFNPLALVEQPLRVLGTLAIVLLLKPLAAVLIIRLLRGEVRTAATVGIGLAQIGEFSFILASLGVSLKVLPREAMDLVIVAAIISIALNPPLFRLAERLLQRRAAGAKPAPVPATPALVVLAGYGALGRRVARRCLDDDLPLVVIDTDLGARRRTPRTVVGNPAQAEVLQAAGIHEASVLVVADLELAHKLRVCQMARALNPTLKLVAAAEGEAEAAWLREFGATVVREGLDEQSARLHGAVRGYL
jgi:CPA2 family monovalent cation:H+ antiporter-2